MFAFLDVSHKCYILYGFYHDPIKPLLPYVQAFRTAGLDDTV
jgi:hypothetical protein